MGDNLQVGCTGICGRAGNDFLQNVIAQCWRNQRELRKESIPYMRDKQAKDTVRRWHVMCEAR